MRLTFSNNNFVFQDPRDNFLSAAWKPVARHVFQTNKIKEAARFRKYADSKAEMIFTKLMLKAMPLPSGGLLSPMPLLDFQEHKGVPFILSRNHSYIAHEPGLGKSAQFITAVNTKPGMATVTCPSFLKTNWAREITKWSYGDFPEIEIVPESAKQHETNWGADYLIVSDSMLLKDWVREGILKRKTKFWGLDEAQRFKTYNASRTTALFGGYNGKVKSPSLIYDSEYIVALSGTPLLNRPMELWPLLYGLAPEVIDFMPLQDFGFRYCGPWRDNRGHYHFTGSSNEEELNERIMGTFMQRIRKKDVLKDLPDKVRDIIVLERDGRKKDVIEYDRQMLRKISSKSEIPKSMGGLAKLRHVNGVAKVEGAAEFVRFYLKNDIDESIILFAYHRDVVQSLAEALKEFQPMVIQGGINDEERTRVQDAFQSGHRRLIIGNIHAMNLGLTLTRATREIFAEYDWSGKINEQAEDRGHRIGQKSSLFIQYLVLADSIDEHILNRVLEKDEDIERIIG